MHACQRKHARSHSRLLPSRRLSGAAARTPHCCLLHSAPVLLLHAAQLLMLESRQSWWGITSTCRPHALRPQPPKLCTACCTNCKPPLWLTPSPCSIIMPPIPSHSINHACLMRAAYPNVGPLRGPSPGHFPPGRCGLRLARKCSALRTVGGLCGLVLWVLHGGHVVCCLLLDHLAQHQRVVLRLLGNGAQEVTQRVALLGCCCSCWCICCLSWR